MTKITGEWLDHLGTQAICGLLESNGYQAYLVGGCVRNALLSVPVADVDIATDAVPDEIESLAKSAGMKSIPTGKDHGTITVIAHGESYEVTSFRKDIATDGRRAVVAFTDDVSVDAGRRDFTMNALYAKSDGQVLDPLDGLPDLNARRVRFIGSADKRIKEDSLRILRFFRFTAHFGNPSEGIDADGLAACAKHVDMLDALPKERIGTEMRKLLAADDPAPACASMGHSGVLLRILPGASTDNLAPLIHLEALSSTSPSWLRRLGIMGGQNPSENLRLSRAETKYLMTMIAQIDTTSPPAELAYRQSAKMAVDVVLIRAVLMQETLPDDIWTAIEKASNQVFPVKAADLQPELEGVHLGRHLKQLEDRWVSSGFQLSKAQLLS